jgi:hypothetical protein
MGPLVTRSVDVSRVFMSHVRVRPEYIGDLVTVHGCICCFFLPLLRQPNNQNIFSQKRLICAPVSTCFSIRAPPGSDSPLPAGPTCQRPESQPQKIKPLPSFAARFPSPPTAAPPPRHLHFTSSAAPAGAGWTQRVSRKTIP